LECFKIGKYNLFLKYQHLGISSDKEKKEVD